MLPNHFLLQLLNAFGYIPILKIKINTTRTVLRGGGLL